MWPYFAAAGVGIAFAVYCHFAQKRRLHKKLHQRFPDLMERWCRLDRRTRHSLRNDMRTGQTAPAEHAEVVIGMIDMSVTFDEERLRTFWRRLFRAYCLYLGILIALVVALFFSRRGLRIAEVAYIGWIATIVVRLTVGGFLIRRRLQSWPANRARTREHAMRDLSSLEAGQTA